MGDESEDKVIEMNSRKSTLLSMLDRPAAEAERAGKTEPETQTEDESDNLPGPEEGYAACSRLDNKPQLMLCLLKADDSVKSYSYSDLRSIDLQPGNKPGNGPGLVLRFVGVAEVRIEGRRCAPSWIVFAAIASGGCASCPRGGISGTGMRWSSPAWR